MQPIAKQLTPDQRFAVAVYYAGLNPDGSGPTAGTATAGAAAGAASTVGASPAASGATASAGAGRAAAASSSPARAGAGPARGGRGAQLANAGDEALGVQGCVNCHGPGGIGSGVLYPYLAGQHAAYLAATLGAWRDGTRNNDPSGQMALIGKALTPQDAAAVADYYAAQAPRPTALDADAMARWMPPAGGQAVTSGPTQAQPPAAATPDITQATPRTGGGQGPGGGGATDTSSTGAPLGGAPSPPASAAR